MMILGLTGVARSGKDSVFNTLDVIMAGRNEGCLRVQISRPLKAYCREVFDWTREHTDGGLKDVPDKRYPIAATSHVFVRSLLNGSLFECACGALVHASAIQEGTPGECITYLTPRHAMQQLGGEFAESTFPAIYAVAAARKAAAFVAESSGLAVVTDCRFLRDIQAVKDVGGLIIEVRRETASGMLSPDATQHKSELERQRPDFQALVDYHIDNDGTLVNLGNQVDKLWAALE